MKEISQILFLMKLENLYSFGNNFIKIGSVLIQWGSVSISRSRYTLTYPVPYKNTPAITVSTWDTGSSITHTGRSKTECQFISTNSKMGFDWTLIGIV